MNYYDYAYDYGYGYGAETTDVATSLFGGLFASMGIMMLISGAISIFLLVAMWKLFKKAGKNGWECLIPIYNIIVLLEITELPTWYIALFFVPFANIYAMFKIYIELAHKFGQSTGFGVAMVFFAIVCIPILAFGDAKYQGKGNVASSVNNQSFNQDPYAYNQMPQQNVYGGQMEQPMPMQQPTFEPVNNGQPVGQPQFITEPVVQPQVAEPVQQPVNIFESPMPNPTPQVNVFENPVEQPTADQNVAPTITDIPQANNQQVKFCPNCGNKTAMNADTCFMCGHKF